VIPKGARKPAQPADPASTVRPRRRTAAKTATLPAATDAPIDAVQLDAAILRFVRRYPNLTVDLGPLAEQLKLDPYRIQLAVEELGRGGWSSCRSSSPGRRGVRRSPRSGYAGSSSTRAASPRTSRQR